MSNAHSNSPANSYPRIVVTGMGIISPLGIGCDEFAAGLAAGQTVYRPADFGGSGPLPLAACSDLGDFEPKKLVKPRKSIKLMCREIQLGVAAAQLAVEHAQLDVGSVDSDRFGTVLGSEMLYGPPGELSDLFEPSIESSEFDLVTFGKHISELFPLWLLKYLPNMPACHAAIAQQAYGANNSIVQGDASSLLAIAEAVSVMQRGWTDVMIAGGTGSAIQPVRSIHLDERLYAKASDSGPAMCRPFDQQRDGTVGGEGAAAVLLETEQHARARGAQVLAVFGGFGRTFQSVESLHENLENGATVQATRRAILASIDSAGISTDDIDHVNAHGLGTIGSDEREAVAISESLGSVPVTAPKSYFGNLGAGSGAVELAASVIALQQGQVPATLNYENPDPRCPVNVISGAAKSVDKSAAVVLSQSQTGQSVSVSLLKA